MCKNKARKNLYKVALLYNNGQVSSIDLKNAIAEYLLNTTEQNVYSQLNSNLFRLAEEGYYAK